MKYTKKLEILSKKEYIKKNYSLDNIKNVLTLLGNPQNKLKNVIHITGTNGKGSVAHYTAKILENHGYKVGLFTSPHILDVSERICINHKPIPKSTLEKYLKKVYSVIDNGNAELIPHYWDKLTYFELLTCVMFLYFADEQPDFTVLEVGLGGKLDATNTIPHSIVSVITNISLDHTEVLGKTIKKIALDKSGIIKNNSVCIYGDNNIVVKNILKKVCKEKNSELVFLNNNEIKNVKYDFYNWNTKFKIQFNHKLTRINTNLKSKVDGRREKVEGRREEGKPSPISHLPSTIYLLPSPFSRSPFPTDYTRLTHELTQTNTNQKTSHRISQINTEKNSTMNYNELENQKFIPITIPMCSITQPQNVLISLKIFEQLYRMNLIKRFNINQIKKSFNISIPSRMQKLSFPVSRFPFPVIVDGSHNPQAIKNFVNTLNLSPFKNIILCFTMMKEKDYKTSIKLISKLKNKISNILLYQLPTNRAQNINILYKEFIKYFKIEDIITFNTINEMLKFITKFCIKQKIFFCGSLYAEKEVTKSLGVKEL